MIVVSDTSPVHYLALIGEIEILPALYGLIHIPAAVQLELTSPGAPPPVREWATSPPDWLQITPERLLHNDPLLAGLDYGEQAALALALELNADLVLVDDGAARVCANRLGLKPAGTLRVLADAALRELIDPESALTLLERTNFRASPKVIAAIRDRIRDDRRSS